MAESSKSVEARNFAFQAAVQRNIASWQQSRRTDERGTLWLLLAAYEARVDVQENPESIIYADGHAFIQKRVMLWLREHGDAYVLAHPHRLRLVAGYWPQEYKRLLALP